MMQVIENAMRLQAQRSVASAVVSRIGLITNYDPNNYCAKVALYPDDRPTGWLPIASLWVGNGWGMFSPPSINEQVSVIFVEGDLNNGFVQGRFYNNQDRPLGVASGELWLMHAKGQFLKLTNDGKLNLSDGQGATVILNGDGTISSSGTWNHTGNFNATQTIHADVDVTGGSEPVSLVNHDHNVVNVQTGGTTITTTPPL